MKPSADMHSPKQVALALGVSESSLKRWCDLGLIKTVRTVGGHRKVATSDVLQFVRDRQMTPAAPELLGLPPISPLAERGLSRNSQLLADSLLAGDEATCRQIVFNLVLAKHSLSKIFDEVIAKAFHEIGDRWACQQADVYQERRACEMMLRTLWELRKSQAPPMGNLVACGATATGDHYTLQTFMAEVVLRDQGIRATSLGTSIPFLSLIRAVEETRPHLFWLSVSHIPDVPVFLADFANLSNACQQSGAALLVGGCALTQSIREHMVYTCYCDTMQHLASFADTFERVQQPAQQPDSETTQQ